MVLLASDMSSVLPSLTPTTLLLLGNELVTLLQCKPQRLPPILPAIQGLRTLQTLRRISIKQLLSTPKSPIQCITKKGKTESTRDDRLRAQTYHDAGLDYKQIMAKTGK